MDDVDINAKEERTLLEASFEPLADDGLLWGKNSVCYGRQAALQEALGKLYEEEGLYLFDTT
jgi:hypothetical protein